MAEPVTAYKGYKGKLFATSEEADKSLLWDPLCEARDLAAGVLGRRITHEAHSFASALEPSVPFLKAYIVAYERYYGKID